MEKGFTDLRLVGTGRGPYVWKSMVLVARKPAGGGAEMIILGLNAFHGDASAAVLPDATYQ